MWRMSKTLVCTNDLWSCKRTHTGTRTHTACWMETQWWHHSPPWQENTHTHPQFSVKYHTLDFLAHKIGYWYYWLDLLIRRPFLLPRSALKRRPFYFRGSHFVSKVCSHFISKSRNIFCFVFFSPRSRRTTSGVFFSTSGNSCLMRQLNQSQKENKGRTKAEEGV